MMGAGQRRRHSPELKARIALEACDATRSGREIARAYRLQPAQIAQWKRQLREHAAIVFQAGRCTNQGRCTRLELRIRQLQTELEWLRGRLQLPADRLRDLVDPHHPALSISRQCALLGLPRRTYYYRPVAPPPDQHALMAAISRQYLISPRSGSRRITAALRQQGWRVNRKRIQRLTRVMVSGSPLTGRRGQRQQPMQPVRPHGLHQGRRALTKQPRRRPDRFRPRIGSRAALLTS